MLSKASVPPSADSLQDKVACLLKKIKIRERAGEPEEALGRGFEERPRARDGDDGQELRRRLRRFELQRAHPAQKGGTELSGQGEPQAKATTGQSDRRDTRAYSEGSESASARES